MIIDAATIKLPARAPSNVSTLFVDGERAIWARFPNGDPDAPSGLCLSKANYAGESTSCSTHAKGLSTTKQTARDVKGTRVNAGANDKMRYGLYPDFDIMVGGYADFFAPPGGLCAAPNLTGCGASKGRPCTVPCSVAGSRNWFAHYDRLTGVSTELQWNGTLVGNNGQKAKTWTNGKADGAVIRFLGPPTWGSHTWPILDIDAENRISVGQGTCGQQFADMSAVTNDTAFYIEGLAAELDSAREWVLDKGTGTLKYIANATGGQGAPKLVELPLLQTVVRMQNTSHVALSGVRIAHVVQTQLLPYEVPSGGDWSVGRYGAVVVEDSDGVNISDCHFEQVGGNGVLLSRHVSGAVVSGNHFDRPGESAVVAVGVSDMSDGTAPTFPTKNIVKNNWMHDLGVFGKETSCYFQAVAGQNVVADNICYNGPRAVRASSSSGCCFCCHRRC